MTVQHESGSAPEADDCTGNGRLERRRYSSRMQRLLLPLMFTLLAPGAVAETLTPEECARHRDEFLQTIEDNRRDGVKRLEAELAETVDRTRRDRLTQEVDELWEFEESMRAVGDQTFRDCMRSLGQVKR